MKKDTLYISSRECIAYVTEPADMLLIQPIDEHDLELLDQEVSIIQSSSDKSFSLVAFKVNDWQQELTPWPAPAVFGKTPFGDGAGVTLDFITTDLLPGLAERGMYAEGKTRLFLGGYSLAGLFALWAGYASRLFEGVAAVSPSVWYDRWTDFASQHPFQAASAYLSLGDKEEKTRNAVMARVGDCIRKQHELLTLQNIPTTLEWNKGNHFQDSDKRTARGFAWLMDRP